MAAGLLLALIAGVAAEKANRVSLLPLACSWILLGVLLSEVEPAPDPQSQLRLIADSGGSTVVEGRVTRTTPLRVAQASLPFGKGTRQEQSESLDLRVASADGLPVAGGLRATLYGPVTRRFLPFTAAMRSTPRLQCVRQNAISTLGCGMPLSGCGSRA